MISRISFLHQGSRPGCRCIRNLRTSSCISGWAVPQPVLISRPCRTPDTRISAPLESPSFYSQHIFNHSCPDVHGESWKTKSFTSLFRFALQDILMTRRPSSIRSAEDIYALMKNISCHKGERVYSILIEGESVIGTEKVSSGSEGLVDASHEWAPLPNTISSASMKKSLNALFCEPP